MLLILYTSFVNVQILIIYIINYDSIMNYNSFYSYLPYNERRFKCSF